MPKIENIPAGAYELDPDAEVTEESLEEELEAARAAFDEVRSRRAAARAESPADQVLSALAETEDEYQAAIAAVNAAEKRLGRFRGGRGPGRRIPVGVARSGDGAAEVENG